jgi:hypothetical protein
MKTIRYGGYSIPVLEKPLIWGRDASGYHKVMVAHEGDIETESQRQELLHELMAIGGHPIGGGDFVPYVSCQRTEIATQSTLAGTAKGLIPGSASVPLAAGASVTGTGGFWYTGRAIRITLWGVMTTASATPGTFTPDWAVDTAATGTTGNSLGAGPASGTLATSITNAAWAFKNEVTCQAINGASGKLWGQGIWMPNTTLFATQVELFMPNTAPAQATIDTTQNSFVKFFGTLGSASDTMAITAALWEIMN